MTKGKPNKATKKTDPSYPPCPKCGADVTQKDIVERGAARSSVADSPGLVVSRCPHCGYDRWKEERRALVERFVPHPVCAMFPMLDEEALARLADDIREHGLREPIVHHGDVLLDGRNRLAACKLAGVEPVLSPWRREEALIIPWIISKNLHRRHLSTSQRAAVAAALATLGQGEQTGKLAGIPTQAQAAEMLGVSERTVRTAKVVLESGDAELIEAVKQGDMSVSAAAQSLRPPAPAPAPSSTDVSSASLPAGVTASALHPHLLAELAYEAGYGTEQIRLSLLRPRVEQRLGRAAPDTVWEELLLELRLPDWRWVSDPPAPGKPGVSLLVGAFHATAAAAAPQDPQPAKVEPEYSETPPSSAPSTDTDGDDSSAELELLEEQGELDAQALLELLEEQPDIGLPMARLELSVVLEEQGRLGESEKLTNERWQAALDFGSVEGWWVVRGEQLELVPDDDDEGEDDDSDEVTAPHQVLEQKGQPAGQVPKVRPLPVQRGDVGEVRLLVFITGLPAAGGDAREIERGMDRLEALGKLAVARGYSPLLPHLQRVRDIYGRYDDYRPDKTEASVREAARACAVALATAAGQLGGGLWEVMPDEAGESTAETEAEAKAFAAAHPGPSRPHSLCMTWRSWRAHFEQAGLAELWRA
jgi:hypothetical protein